MSKKEKIITIIIIAITITLITLVIPIIVINIKKTPTKCNEQEVYEKIKFKGEGFVIKQIGEHDYIFDNTAYGGGVCHYEDCQYCKTLKEDEK